MKAQPDVHSVMRTILKMLTALQKVSAIQPTPINKAALKQIENLHAAITQVSSNSYAKNLGIASLPGAIAPKSAGLFSKNSDFRNASDEPTQAFESPSPRR